MAITKVNLDSVSLALSTLVTKWAYIGRLAARADLRFSEDVPTAATDGIEKIFINKDFFSKLSSVNRVVLIAHEMMHILLRNLSVEEPQENHELWNIAEDIVINTMLIDHFTAQGVTGSKAESRVKLNLDMQDPFFTNALFPKTPGEDTVKFSLIMGLIPITIADVRKKTVTDIYWEIKNQIPTLVGNGPSGGSGSDEGEGSTPEFGEDGERGYTTIDDHSKLKDRKKQSKEQQEKTRKKWQKAANNEAMLCEKTGDGKGDTSGRLDSMVDDFHQPTISWRDMLRNAISSVNITDITYRKFSKRSIALRTPMPGAIREDLSIVVHVDTSGSTAGFLKMFFSELRGILQTLSNAKALVIQCDCSIQKVEEFTSSSDISKFEVSGFGGTSHKPVIDFVNKMDEAPAVLLSFTDGESDVKAVYPALRPGIQSIFVLPKGCNPAYVEGCGTVIVIDEDPAEDSQ